MPPDDRLLSGTITAGAVATGAPQSGHFGHDGQLHGGHATVTGVAGFDSVVAADIICGKELAMFTSNYLKKI